MDRDEWFIWLVHRELCPRLPDTLLKSGHIGRQIDAISEAGPHQVLQLRLHVIAEPCGASEVVARPESRHAKPRQTSEGILSQEMQVRREPEKIEDAARVFAEVWKRLRPVSVDLLAQNLAQGAHVPVVRQAIGEA